MAVTPKKVVRNFLESNVFLNPEELYNYFSNDFKMHWRASSGLRTFDFNDYYRLCQYTSNSYKFLRAEISELFAEQDKVVAAFVLYVKTIENPTEEIPIGYFISIFDIKNGLILKINQSSHQKT